MTDSTVQGSMGSIQPWGGVILNHMVCPQPEIPALHVSRYRGPHQGPFEGKEVYKMKSNKLKKDAFKTLLFFLIILIFASQNSCSTTGSRTTVAPENRIPVVL